MASPTRPSAIHSSCECRAPCSMIGSDRTAELHAPHVTELRARMAWLQSTHRAPLSATGPCSAPELRAQNKITDMLRTQLPSSALTQAPNPQWPSSALSGQATHLVLGSAIIGRTPCSSDSSALKASPALRSSSVLMGRAPRSWAELRAQRPCPTLRSNSAFMGRAPRS